MKHGRRVEVKRRPLLFLHFGVYTLFCVLHTVACIAGRQPHRLLCHVTALTACAVMANHCLVELAG